MTFYDLTAPVYGLWAAAFESRAHRLAGEALAEHPIRDLLEVAVGPGTESPAGSAPRRYVGVDLSMRMLRQARRRLPGACLCQADARALPFRAESFDGLLDCYMVDLLPESEIPAVLREFRRVLRAGGRLVLLTMAAQKPALQKVWMALYRRAPLLVGGCRPVDPARWLRESEWDVVREEEISQLGFRSLLVIARPHS